MSRGLHAKYKILEIQNNIVIYAYGGSNFNYSYDEEIFNSCDGRIKIQLDSLSKDVDVASEFEKENIVIIKPCFYAEDNIYGVDILALKTINVIVSKYKKDLQLPEEGFWVV